MDESSCPRSSLGRKAAAGFTQARQATQDVIGGFEGTDEACLATGSPRVQQNSSACSGSLRSSSRLTARDQVGTSGSGGQIVVRTLCTVPTRRRSRVFQWPQNAQNPSRAVRIEPACVGGCTVASCPDQADKGGELFVAMKPISASSCIQLAFDAVTNAEDRGDSWDSLQPCSQ